jgi:hypothetical protein
MDHVDGLSDVQLAKFRDVYDQTAFIRIVLEQSHNKAGAAPKKRRRIG